MVNLLKIRWQESLFWETTTDFGYNSNIKIRPVNFSTEHKFLSIADTRKAPIERQVSKIVRLKALDYDTETGSYKKERKEYLMYYENWYGKDWKGEPIAPVTDHIEGLYQDPLEKTVYSQAGEPLQKELTGFHNDVYYIPFDKKTVSDIIKK